jgi:hypothetical protein
MSRWPGFSGVDGALVLAGDGAFCGLGVGLELAPPSGGERPDLARALEFYDRWLPGTMRRIAAITHSCVPECAMRRCQW